MKFTKWRELLFITAFALLLTIPVFLFTKDLTFHRYSDYDLLLPALYFARDAVTDPARFLFWNPFVGTGIPNLGDLGSTLWSPLFVLPTLFFGVENGVRVMIIIGILLSGYTMWIFLDSLKTSTPVRLWGAALYMVSGVVSASVDAGHLCKLFPYSLVPLFLSVSIRRRMNFRHMFIAAFVWVFMILNTDFYVPYYLLFFYFLIRMYFALKYRAEMGRAVTSLVLFYVLCIVLLSPKLFFIVRDVLPNFQRFYTSDPYAGSIHAFFLPLLFSMPLQVSFYDRPTIQRIIGFQFNWFEYYAFITPLPFLGLLSIKAIFKRDETKIFLILIAVGFFYIALGYPYSPFYWIFHLIPQLHIFRVPSRVVTPLVSVVIALCALGLDAWYRKAKTIGRTALYAVLIASVVLTSISLEVSILRTFEPKRLTEESVAKELRSRDPSSYYVVSFVCCMQTYLMQEHIPLLNFYYSWRTRSTPSFLNASENGYDYDVLRTVRPTYIIAYSKDSFEGYNYDSVFTKGTITVWKTSNPTHIPKL